MICFLGPFVLERILSTTARRCLGMFMPEAGTNDCTSGESGAVWWGVPLSRPLRLFRLRRGKRSTPPRLAMLTTQVRGCS